MLQLDNKYRGKTFLPANYGGKNEQEVPNIVPVKAYEQRPDERKTGLK